VLRSERATTFSQVCSDHIADVYSQPPMTFEILSSSTSASRERECYLRLCGKQLLYDAFLWTSSLVIMLLLLRIFLSHGIKCAWL